jgi:hypothetical protein
MVALLAASSVPLIVALPVAPDPGAVLEGAVGTLDVPGMRASPQAAADTTKTSNVTRRAGVRVIIF